MAQTGTSKRARLRRASDKPTFMAIAPAAGYLSQLILAPDSRLRLGTARQAADTYARGAHRNARRVPAGYRTNLSA